MVNRISDDNRYTRDDLRRKQGCQDLHGAEGRIVRNDCRTMKRVEIVTSDREQTGRTENGRSGRNRTNDTIGHDARIDIWSEQV